MRRKEECVYIYTHFKIVPALYTLDQLRGGGFGNHERRQRRQNINSQ